MIDVNSNCSRVDAVKAMAGLLRMQAPPPARTTGSDPQQRRVQNQLNALDEAVKQGDAQKAENILAAAASAVKELQTQSPRPGSEPGSGQVFRGLDVYA